MTARIPEVGDKAPAFVLPDDSGRKVRLADLIGSIGRVDRGLLILYFYPAAMTPSCTRQACDFRDRMPALSEHGFAVVGISPDTPERLSAFRERDGLPFVLLSDPSHQVMEKYGAWGAKQLYGKTVTGVIRSTFAIDSRGRIALAQRNVRATGHVARLLSQLDGPG